MISIGNLTYTYPGRGQPALRDFSLEVREGEFLLVVGASGSGKSTLLRLLNGLVPYFHGGSIGGEVSVMGMDPVELGPGEMSRGVGLVFQDPEAQMVAEVVEDEIAFGMENAGLPLETMRKRLGESMGALGIEHLRGRRLSTLSGGERQRVAIASVLALYPRVLVLDEPTSQLDPHSAEEVLDAVVRLNKVEGLTVVLSEHRLERVVQHADRILYMERGGGSVIGPPREVLAHIPLAPPIAQVSRLLGWEPMPLSVEEARPFVGRVGVKSGGLGGQRGREAQKREPIVRMENVSFAYGQSRVLSDFSLEVGKGEITALLGRNGSGKTTILKLILGLAKPQQGVVTTAGLDTRRASLAEMGRGVGYVPQQPDVMLFAETVEGEVAFTRRAQGLEPDGVGLITELGLLEYRESDPRDLSVGEKQRVALAAALAGEPGVLVLDEPTRGLDYIQKDALVKLLCRLRDSGRAILLATHDVELVAEFADRVIIIDRGEISADGPPHEAMSGSSLFSTQLSRLFSGMGIMTVGDVKGGRLT